MKMARIHYLLSEKGRKAHILSGGDGKQFQTLEVEATPEIIDLAAVDESGNVELNVGFSHIHKGWPEGRVNIDVKIYNDSWGPKLSYDSEIHRFDEPQTADQLIAWEKARREKISRKEAELQPELERAKEEHEKERARREAAEKEREEADRKWRAAQEEQAQKREAEKAEWIEKFGSDYLKDAHRLGYNCQRQYVKERADKEFPEFIVDFDDECLWKERTCPSPEALEEVKKLIQKGYEAKVVWLTNAPYDDDGDDYFESCEAVIIKNYLDKYNLIKFINNL